MRQKPRNCSHCGEEFIPERRNAIYCSGTCRQYSYLKRKNGSAGSMPALPQPVQPEVPALVIEQPSEESNLSKEVNFPSISDQPAVGVQAPLKPEPSRSSQKPPVDRLIAFEFARRSFSFISPDFNSSEVFMSRKNHQDLLNEKKQVVNEFLGFWWLLFKPGKEEKQLAETFGNKLKPYLISLLMMKGSRVPINTFKSFRDQLTEIGDNYYSFENCPKEYPLFMFYDALLKYFKRFVQEKESSLDRSFTFQLRDKTKAEIETILLLIESFTVNTPEGWKLA